MVALPPPNMDVPAIHIVGEAEVVYSAAKEQCAPSDYPDVALRAFRNDKGQVIAVAANVQNRSFAGADLNSIKHNCNVNLLMHKNPDPAAMSWNSYLSSTWTENGRDVMGLVHNEYLANQIPGRCTFTTAKQCWYNVVVQVHSSDSGRTFMPSDPPALVAGMPFKQEIEQGRNRGFFNPSNIVKYQNAVYFISSTSGGANQKAGPCLFRSATPFDPTSWRGFDGKGFTAKAIDPYRADPSGYIPCQPLKMGGVPNSIAYYPSAKKFVAIMGLHVSPDAPDGGLQYAWSVDLIHWSKPAILGNLASHSSKNCALPYRYTYPSIVDPASPSRNFDVVGANPYLYMTRTAIKNCKSSPERDLVRIKMQIVG